MRDKLGGFPYEVKKESGRTVIRFFPKSPTAKYPESVVFVLSLDRERNYRKLFRREKLSTEYDYQFTKVKKENRRKKEIFHIKNYCLVKKELTAIPMENDIKSLQNHDC